MTESAVGTTHIDADLAVIGFGKGAKTLAATTGPPRVAGGDDRTVRPDVWWHLHQHRLRPQRNPLSTKLSSSQQAAPPQTPTAMR